MSKKSLRNTPNSYGKTRNAVSDVDVARSAVELLPESDAKYAESDNEATIVEFESNENLYTPSEIEKLIQIYEYYSFLISDGDSIHKEVDFQVLKTDSVTDKMEVVQNVYDKDEEQELNQLHLAAEQDDTDSVRRLLISSANVDVLDTKQNTPLHYATLNGQVDAVNLLLSKNACVNSRNALGQTSLHLAAVIGHLAIAQMLLDSNADVHVTDQFVKTPIHVAAMLGHYDLVQLLMKHSVLLICYGNRPLHLAAKYGQTEAVQFLIYDENPDAKNFYGDTPLHLALENGHFEVAEILLRSNADANSRNAACETPLHIAAEMGFTEIVKALIEHEGEVNAFNRNCDTALHHATKNGHFEVAEVLLRNNANASIRNESGKTPLHIAAEMGYTEIVKALLDHKGEVNAIDRNGDAALHLAASNGHIAVVNALLNQTTEMDAQICSQLSVCNGQATTTTLHLAVEQGHAQTVDNLILNGANVNACNNAKMTPLHLACQNGHTSIVELLLDNHAIVDVIKQCEETPFYIAAKNGHADVSDLLLRRGICNFVLKYYGKKTPLHVAVEEGHTKVVEVILKHSCRISGKLAKDDDKLQEIAKKSVEARGFIPAELLKGDGRRFSARIVWREENTPIEIRNDSRGYNSLKLAVTSDKTEMVRLLLSGDQCVYSDKDLFESFTKLKNLGLDPKRYRNLIQVLANSSKFNVNHQDKELNTLLHIVVKVCRCPNTKWSNSFYYHITNDTIQLLLEKGADFNMKNSYGETPLIIASKSGCYLVIQLLFDWEHKSGMKLDLDARDQYGATALIKAAEGNHVSAVRLLLNHDASVNLYDYNGFTALHAVIYNPNRNWFDLHFFCKELRKRKFDGDDHLEVSSKEKPTCGEDPTRLKVQLEKIRESYKKTARIKEEIVKLLLANNETNVNVIDFGGNTPLDLAIKSSKRINSATLKALKNRGAIQNFQELEDEAPIEVPRIDERGRNPLHRLIISYILYSRERLVTQKADKGIFDISIFELMVDRILVRPENFKHLTAVSDEKGRIPLHYAVMQPSYLEYLNRKLVGMLVELGSNVNAADIYGKTPLHYAEFSDQYELLVKYGAKENTKAKHGHTPKELKQLRVIINQDRAKGSQIEKFVKETRYASTDIAQGLLNTNHVTELSKRKLVETIRIYSQSPCPQESSKVGIWKIWTENDFILLNRRVNQLKPLIQHFIERLADGIKEKDWRFECQPILVGSADEETKVIISADFDFSCKLIKFSQLCEAFPHPLGPNGYFQLRRKTSEDTKSRSDEKFESFFNLDQCLLTNEVNFRFQVLAEEVFKDSKFWQDELLFEWNLTDEKQYQKPAGLSKTLELRMTHPIEDGEGDFLFVNISIDIAACVQVQGWWSEAPLSVGSNPVMKSDGSTFVFDRPRFNPCKSRDSDFIFSDSFARISFAPVESRIIKESSPLIKAAYIVCKMILYPRCTTYQLKNCLLFCMESLNARNGSETMSEEEIAPEQLAFWVERLMFCFMEFSRHDFYPCYFMPSFRQQVHHVHHLGTGTISKSQSLPSSETCQTDVDKFLKFHFYLYLCPDDTAIDIPIVYDVDSVIEGNLSANHDPNWEQFNREEFITKLSSRMIPAK